MRKNLKNCFLVYVVVYRNYMRFTSEWNKECTDTLSSHRPGAFLEKLSSFGKSNLDKVLDII